VLFWFAVGLLVLTPIVATLLWFFFLPTRVGTDQAVQFVNRQLVNASNLRLRTGSMAPTWNGMILTEVRVEAEHEDRWHPFLESSRITVGVSLLDLLLRRPQTFTIEADSPVLTLNYDADGVAVLPELRSTRETKKRDEGAETRPADGFRVHLQSTRFVVAREDTTLVWWDEGTLRMNALPRTGGYDMEILEGGGFLPQLGLVVRELHGRGAVTGEGYFVDFLSIETDAGSVEAAGELVDQKISARVTAEQWPWEFFAELLEQPGVDVPGAVRLEAQIGGTLNAPVVGTELAGVWRDEAFRAEVAGEFEDPAIRVRRALVEWGRTTIEGTGTFRFDGRWSLAANVDELDLSQVERLAPWIHLPVSDLGGPMRMEGDRGRLRVFHDHLEGSFAGVPLQEVSGEWSLVEGTVEWAGTGKVAGGSLQMSGASNSEQLVIRGEGSAMRLADLHDLHHTLSNFSSGRARFDFEAVGPPGALDIRGRCRLSDARVWRIRAEDLAVEFDGRLGEGRDSLWWTARGTGFWAGELPFETVAGQGRWRKGELEVPSLRLASVDTSLSAAFTATAHEDGWSIDATVVHLRAAEAELRADGPLGLDIVDGGVGFRRFLLTGNAGDLEMSGWVRDRATDLDVRTRNLDLDLVMGGLLAAPIEGRVNLDAHVSSGEDRLHLVLEAEAPGVRYGEAEVESLVTNLVIGREGQRVLVEHLDLRSSAGHVTATGEGHLPEASVTGDQPWWTPLQKVQAWRGTVRAADFDLGVLSRLVASERELRGRADARLELRGPAGNRIGSTEGRIEGFGLNGYGFDEIEWDMEYDDGRLTIASLSASAGEWPLRIRGHLPLVLAWGETTGEWFPDRAMDLEFHLPDDVLEQLPLFVPLVAAAEGKVEADLQLQGTPKKPELHGSLTIREAGVRVTGREEIYRDFRADVAVLGERIVIRDITARQGEDGRLRGNGEYWLFGENAGRYRMDLRVDRALAQASGEYAVSFDGDFVITDGPRIPGVVIAIPHIQGNVDVRTGVILYDFSDPENVVYLTGPRQAPAYVYDLEVEAPRRVYWRTPSANIELEAKLNMSQSLEGLKMWGTIRSLRGTYFFLENKFTVESGELIFDEAESMNPKIDASAITRVTRAMGQKQYEKEEIHIELTGRIQQPEMSLWSSSGLAQTDIVSLLTVGRFGIGEGEYTSGDQRLLVGVTGTQYLVRQLARQFPEISPLLADIEVGTTVGKGSTGERIYTTLGVSRYFTPDLLLRYSQVVGGSGRDGTAIDELNLWDVSAEYRIGRLFFLTGEVIERRVTSSLGSGTPEHEVQYNLDVRARLEY
jgi:autotransporter translocation and assembly factor TamB